MSARAWTLAASLFLAAITTAGAAATAESLYRQAYAKETAERDPESAALLYKQVVQQTAGKGLTAAKAQFHLGACLELLGQDAEAMTAYEAVTVNPASPPDLVQTSAARLERLRRPPPVVSTAAAPSPATPPVPAGPSLSLRWLESWTLSVAPGVSTPIDAEISGRQPGRSAVLGFSAIRRMNHLIGFGLDLGYAFGHDLDAPPPVVLADPGKADNTLKIVHVAAQAEFGYWQAFGKTSIRPYGTAGFGFYNVNQVGGGNTADFRFTVSQSHNYSGVNAGGGLLVKLSPSVAAGPDLRYHILFASGHDLSFLTATLRLTLLL